LREQTEKDTLKNATKHADELKSLIKKLHKQFQVEPKSPLDPLTALVRGAMSFDVSDAKAEEALRLINREFVDLNELRVATDLEIQELLGTRYPAIEKRVAMITQSLNRIFEKEHTMSLDRLKTISKRDARQVLRELPEIHPFVDAYVMLFAFEGHAVPTDDTILSFLKDQGVIEATATIEDAQKFVEHQIKAEESYDVYTVLRKAVAEEKDRAKKK
jgi:endonuclease III